MSRTNALELLVAELTHIPHGPGEHQGMLRAVYHMLRANGRHRGAGEALRRSLATIRRDFPDAQLAYDKAFFDV